MQFLRLICAQLAGTKPSNKDAAEARVVLDFKTETFALGDDSDVSVADFCIRVLGELGIHATGSENPFEIRFEASHLA
jgi:hypothetical protein